MQSAPPAPQPFNATQASNDQTKANVGSAISNSILNNTNQVTPTGSLTYSTNGGQYDYNGNWVPQWTATQQLSPELQGLYNQTTGLAGHVLGQVGNAVNTPLDFSGAPKLPGDQTQLRNDAYNALTSRSNTDLARARSAQDVQLSNQGIQPGSEAWTRAHEGQDRAIVDASNQATINAGNIAGQNLQQAQTLRDQYINELMQQRNQPIADYQALLGLGGGISNQQFQSTPQTQVAATDVAGPQIAAAQMQTDMFNRNAANAQSANNALLGGLFQLGGSALGGWALGGFKSDRRVKRDVHLVGRTFDGQNVYSFRYIDDPRVQMGLMAQEVEKITPAAVYEIGGIKHVDYGLALHAVEGHRAPGIGDDLSDAGIPAVSLAMGLGGLKTDILANRSHDATLGVSSDGGSAAPGQHEQHGGNDVAHSILPGGPA